MGDGCSGRSVVPKYREQTEEQMAPECSVCYINVVISKGLQIRKWPWKYVNSLSNLFSSSEQWQN